MDPRGPGDALTQRPFGGGLVMLDEEWRTARAKLARDGEPPANDGPVRAHTLAGHRFGETCAAGVQAQDVTLDIVGRDGPRRQSTAGIQSADYRRSDPRALGQRPIEHADQFEIRVAQPDQPIEGPERRMPATARSPQPQVALETRGRRIGVRAGDDEMVDPEEHAPRMHGRVR